jgi:hypothetical protein
MKRLVLAATLWMLMGSASVPNKGPFLITATPMALDPDNPAHRDFGPFRYLNGWVLSSESPQFGGYSALSVSGGHFLALADTGDYLRFRMARPGRITDPEYRRLPDFPGRRGLKSDSDSESMAIEPGNGHIWVGFEVYNAIYRFAPGFARTEAAAFPPAMKDWPGDTGPESLARLADGRFLVIAETANEKNGATEALLFPRDPTTPGLEPIRFRYRPPEDYVPTDAQQLPDGRVLILNRHFRVMDGMWAAITIIDPKDIRAGQTVPSRLLADFRRPLNVDNMEGMSITSEGGRIIVWLISDDNKNGIQKTMLMKFAFNPKG